MQNKNDKIIKVANLLDFQAPVGYNLFQIGCIFAEYDMIKSISIYIISIYQFLETGTSDITFIGRDQELK